MFLLFWLTVINWNSKSICTHTVQYKCIKEASCGFISESGGSRFINMTHYSYFSPAMKWSFCSSWVEIEAELWIAERPSTNAVCKCLSPLLYFSPCPSTLFALLPWEFHSACSWDCVLKFFTSVNWNFWKVSTVICVIFHNWTGQSIWIQFNPDY